jgi:succinyl-CoA synthetase beta subunit
VKIHEYQAKDILRSYGVSVPRGRVAFNVQEAIEIATSIDSNVKVIKAQIHAGGRGKGGGIKIAHSVEEVKQAAERMLGSSLITRQTGSQGRRVKKLLIEEGIDILCELYLGITLDRSVSKLVIMGSTEGGVDIEKVAQESPGKILKEWIEPELGLQLFQARKLAFGMGLGGKQVYNAVQFMMKLYKAFIEIDASLVEINPLAVANNGNVIALDAKINFDDNAKFRHPEYEQMRDISEEDPIEVESSKYELNYIKLKGNVGCMVNGAGLAMATMDIIKLAGGEPANFLDVGGGANVDTVCNGFKIILSDPNVKAILINIFGGIVRCDRVAQGVIEAAKTVDIKIPLVVRLEGTNSKEAASLLNNSGFAFHVATSLEDAARQVVEVSKGG